MPIGPTLLIEPDDDASTLLFDHRLRQLHLLAAVALDAVEDVGRDTMRMEAAQDMVLPSHVTHDNSDAFLLAIVIQDFQEGPELGA
jgi:hypothetical protein